MGPGPKPETVDVHDGLPSGDVGRRVLRADQVTAIVGILSKPNAGLTRTQRASVRFAVLCQALIWRITEDSTGDPIRAQLVNLSAGGTGLLSGTPLEPYEPIVFEMILGEIGPIQWRCSVRWCSVGDDGIARIGARFTDLAPTAA